MVSNFRELPQWDSSFAAFGWKRKYFFPHRFYSLPKCGPDGFGLAYQMCGARNLDHIWQLSLFAIGDSLAGLPSDLFFDRDVIWHQQHFERPGQVATADLHGDGSTLYSMAHQSDLVQRISRRRELKTKVEKRFRGWHRVLLNSIANFALAQGYRRLRVPTSRNAMLHTDPHRAVRPELFERVYDRAVLHHFKATQEGRWWNIDLEENRRTIIPAGVSSEVITNRKTLCLFHDIERGAGHRLVNPFLARVADREAPIALKTMLAIEKRTGVKATYNVVGTLLPEVREQVLRDGHSLAFHSYNHGRIRQLARCRRADYRLKGYRPPRSILTSECTDQRLCWHNFEWLASSKESLGIGEPILGGRLVKIPVRLDDYSLYQRTRTFDQWRDRARELIQTNDLVAIGLHDCYAPHWLPHYEALLEEFQSLASLRTLDSVAADLYLAGAA